MNVTFREELDKSTGSELLVSCVRCSGKTAHEVVSSVDQLESVEPDGIYFERAFQIIKCRGCRTITFRDVSSSSEDTVQVSENEWELEAREELYPPRIEGLKDIGLDSFYLPPNIQQVYLETIRALINNCPVLAGIGLRALIEAVCKEKSAVGRNLFAKINDLVTKQILTPSGAELLHKVRSLGNNAAHEVTPHTPQQLSLAINVVEHLLRDVYILPRLVKNKF